MMYGWGHGGWGIGMWLVMAVAMVIFWAIVVFGVVALVRYVGHTHDGPAPVATDAEGTSCSATCRGTTPMACTHPSLCRSCP